MPPRKNSKKAAAHKKRTRRRTKSQNANHRGGNKRKDGSCPIVGIGGSAGGFEAAMELLRHLPSTTLEWRLSLCRMSIHTTAVDCQGCSAK
jgi:chemotaxis response regulator CheB